MATSHRHVSDPPTGPINVHPYLHTEELSTQQVSTDPSMRRPAPPTPAPPQPEPRPRRRHAADPDDTHPQSFVVGSIGWSHVALAGIVGVVLVCITLALSGDPTGAGALAFFALVFGCLCTAAGWITSLVRSRRS